jgi:hypothetical protein
MSHDIMIDLETLGTTPDAVILSIGAVRFDLHAGLIFDAHEDDLFYRAVRIDSQPDRKISGDTIAWWMAQTKEAQTVFTEPRGELFAALVDLHHWIDATPSTAPQVCSNGADFDLPILNHAFGQNTLPLPWNPTPDAATALTKTCRAPVTSRYSARASTITPWTTPSTRRGICA